MTAITHRSFKKAYCTDQKIRIEMKKAPEKESNKHNQTFKEETSVKTVLLILWSPCIQIRLTNFCRIFINFSEKRYFDIGIFTRKRPVQ